MNKKTKVFSFVLSIIMILVLSIGTTLALLTKETTPVKNTFTAVTDLLADGGNFEIQEHKVDADFKLLTGDENLATPDQNGAYVEYNGLFPGTVVDKDPTVKLSKLAAGAYLYVVIEQSNMSAEKDGDLFNWSVSADWTKLGTAGNNQTLYVLKGGDGARALTAGDYSFEILDENKVNVENYASTVNNSLTSGYMTFKAYLVQSYGVTANTAGTALDVFNDTFDGVDFTNN